MAEGFLVILHQNPTPQMTPVLIDLDPVPEVVASSEEMEIVLDDAPNLGILLKCPLGDPSLLYNTLHRRPRSENLAVVY
jgi:hypothetical protein